MKKIIFTTFCLSCLVSFHVQADIQLDMLNDKIDRLDRDLVLLQRKVYQSEGGAPVSLTAPTQSGVSNKGGGSLDDLYDRLNKQEETVRALTNQIETLNFDLKQLNDKVNKINADVDIRFKTLPSNTLSDISVPPKKPIKSSKSAKEDYDAAYALMKKGDYIKAEQSFIQFIADHSKSDLVGNANYWLGETYYARGQYEQAVGIFADGFTKYKTNIKAPDSLLKLGMSMKQLGKNEEACTAFTTLPQEFPKASTSLKDRAKNEAQKLSCK